MPSCLPYHSCPPSCPPSNSYPLSIQLLPAIQLPPSSSCLLSSACPLSTSCLCLWRLRAWRRGSVGSSGKVGLSEKIVPVLLAVEEGAVKEGSGFLQLRRVLGGAITACASKAFVGCRQDEFGILPSRRKRWRRWKVLGTILYAGGAGGCSTCSTFSTCRR